jgi:phospholipid/cholesterol/gamma-HCH transport system ATP-binding protein
MNTLQFTAVTVEADRSYDSAIWNVSFEVAAGELLLVLLEKGHARLPLADAAEGLVAPLQGTVTFLDEDWQALAPARSAAQRGRIGRVFAGQGWVTGMDVAQNITLAQRHHTRRSVADIEEEALELARLLGLPGLPRGRPDAMRHDDLRRAECVRAFLGTPALLILERPTKGVYTDILAPLINLLRTARKGGAAVLWTTETLEIWNHPGLRPTRRARLTGAQLDVLPEVP